MLLLFLSFLCKYVIDIYDLPCSYGFAFFAHCCREWSYTYLRRGGISWVPQPHETMRAASEQAFVFVFVFVHACGFYLAIAMRIIDRRHCLWKRSLREKIEIRQSAHWSWIKDDFTRDRHGKQFEINKIRKAHYVLGKCTLFCLPRDSILLASGHNRLIGDMYGVLCINPSFMWHVRRSGCCRCRQTTKCYHEITHYTVVVGLLPRNAISRGSNFF